ncbi:MAG TPA: recombinase family protein [Candidatus Paceibacterota bacterium]|nr:recombinase family protein [Candidatus Paceibacterota bacterium]
MKVAQYARVSKDEASSTGALQDPENQIQPMRKFCDAMGWEIRDIFIDKASGGSANRPEFQRMLSCVKQKYYDIVLVWALDRFSREGMTNTLAYIKILRHYKTGLKSIQESWLDTTQEGVSDLLLAFMSWVAQQEKQRISERTKAGLAKKKAAGVRLGRPYGWRKNKIEGVKNPSYKNT